MILSKTRVIEVVRRVVDHAEPFHHPAGAEVLDSGHGHDFPEAQLRKTKIKRRARRLGSVAVSPMGVG